MRTSSTPSRRGGRPQGREVSVGRVGLRRFTHWGRGSLWLSFLCVVLVMADISYGMAASMGIDLLVSPGVLLRGLLIGMASYLISVNLRRLGLRMTLWLTALVAAIAPSVVIGAMSGGGLVYDLTAVLKSIYLPVTTALVVIIIRRYRIPRLTVLRFVEYSAVLFTAALILPSLLGANADTYGEYAEGSKGAFFAGNDVAVALGLAMFAVGYRLLFVEYSTARLALLVAAAYACVQLGSRAALAVVLGFVLVMVGCTVLDRARSNQARLRRLLRKWALGSALVVGLSALAFSGYQTQMNNPFQEAKLVELAQGELPRLVLLQSGFDHLADRSSLYHLTGEGADRYERGVGRRFGRERRMVEVDWVDSFGRHGLAFTVLIHLFLIAAFLRAASRALVRRSALSGAIAGAVLLYLGHSALAGHALFSPTPSTILSLYLALIVVQPEEEEPVSVVAVERFEVQPA